MKDIVADVFNRISHKITPRVIEETEKAEFPDNPTREQFEDIVFPIYKKYLSELSHEDLLDCAASYGAQVAADNANRFHFIRLELMKFN